MAPPLRPRPSRTRVKTKTTAFTGKITDNGPWGAAKVVYYFSTFAKKAAPAGVNGGVFVRTGGVFVRTGGDAVRPCCNTCGKTTFVVLSFHGRGSFVPHSWFFRTTFVVLLRGRRQAGRGRRWAGLSATRVRRAPGLRRGEQARWGRCPRWGGRLQRAGYSGRR